MENELTIQCSVCGHILLKMSGVGPSIKGDGIKMSCRKCSENRNTIKLPEPPKE